MNLTYQLITDRTWLRPAGDRAGSQFTASWSATLDLLEREVYALQNRNHPDPVILLDAKHGSLLLDGSRMRANASVRTPAVEVSFDSRQGPMRFRCDRFGHVAPGAHMRVVWQHNVRAIALTLEALRAVERYGASGHGEQYVGYRALPPGGGAFIAGPAEPAEVDPWQVLAGATHCNVGSLKVWHEHGTLEAKVRRRTHPDMAGGSREAYDMAMSALGKLGVVR